MVHSVYVRLFQSYVFVRKLMPTKAGGYLACEGAEVSG
jgi:hypothetical protein